MNHNRAREKLMTIAALLTILTGCSEERVAQISREAADRQARQNETMAGLQQHVAEASKNLVEADAQSRQEMIGVHRDLQQERQRLDTSWSELHQQFRSDSLLVATLPSLGAALLVALLLGFCWYALFATHKSEPSATELNETLLTELTTDEPRFLDGNKHPTLGRNQPDNEADQESN